MSLFVDFHAIQSVPVANLNRDDLGSPKSVTFGGSPRLRVSSQSWKRVIRLGVEQDLGQRARRTRLIPQQTQRVLVSRGWPEDLAKFAGAQVAATAELRVESAGHTSVLLFLPESGIAALADLCEENREALAAGAGKKNPGALLPKDKVNEILTSTTVSISLLGRMLAELPDANIDGAAQVAHAFTTHAASSQRDYFTAVDDWLPDGETGSGHLNTGEFGAGVFYRYASVNVTDLVKNLDGDTATARTALGSFAGQFVESLPQAKRTSTAPHTLPDLVHIAVREHRPLSYAGAFEAPVQMSDRGGFAVPSCLRLAEYAEDMERLTSAKGRLLTGYAAVDSVVDLIDQDAEERARARAKRAQERATKRETESAEVQPTFAGLGKVHGSYEKLADAAVAAALPADGAGE